MTAELAAKIVKQVEYYFSEINLCRDSHLKELLKNSTDGWISYENMLKFPRLAALSTDETFITDSINEAKSEVVEASDKGLKRKSEGEIPEDFNGLLKKYKDQCVYVKGFAPNATMDSIIDYLEKFGGSTYHVHMRRFPKTKKFKSSVFVIFKTKEDAEKFMKNEDAKKLDDKEMIIKWSDVYYTEKQKEYEGKEQDKKVKEEKVKAALDDELEKRMIQGSLIELDGLKKFTTEEFDEKTETMGLRAFIDEKVKEIATVIYVDYFHETGKAIVRMNKGDCAQGVKDKLLEADEAKESFQYNDSKVTIEVLTGEPEKTYWKTVITKLNSRQNKKRPNRNGGPASKRRRN